MYKYTLYTTIFHTNGRRKSEKETKGFYRPAKKDNLEGYGDKKTWLMMKKGEI